VVKKVGVSDADGARFSATIEVGSYRTRSDPEFAQATLAAAGIPSVLAADDAGLSSDLDAMTDLQLGETAHVEDLRQVLVATEGGEHAGEVAE